MQRRPAGRPPRARGLEPPRQRVRHPDRLPAAGALRVHRRLAGLRRRGGHALRRRRLLCQVARRPRRRSVGRRPRADRHPQSGRRRTVGGGVRGHVGGVRRVGGCRGHRAVGAMAPLRRPRCAARATAVDAPLGRVRRRRRGRVAASGSCRRSPARRAPRAVPVGLGVPFRRVARARRATAAGSDRRSQHRRDGIPASVGETPRRERCTRRRRGVRVMGARHRRRRAATRGAKSS